LACPNHFPNSDANQANTHPLHMNNKVAAIPKKKAFA
jgi:hypothetical protein